jgi:hypothetical protein
MQFTLYVHCFIYIVIKTASLLILSGSIRFNLSCVDELGERVPQPILSGASYSISPLFTFQLLFTMSRTQRGESKSQGDEAALEDHIQYEVAGMTKEELDEK